MQHGHISLNSNSFGCGFPIIFDCRLSSNWLFCRYRSWGVFLTNSSRIQRIPAKYFTAASSATSAVLIPSFQRHPIRWGDRVNWTDEMLAGLAAHLVDQRRNGNCGDNGLKPQGVENVTKQLRAKYGEAITKDKVKSCVHQVCFLWRRSGQAVCNRPCHHVETQASVHDVQEAPCEQWLWLG
jgi:hypothetical protein